MKAAQIAKRIAFPAFFGRPGFQMCFFAFWSLIDGFNAIVLYPGRTDEKILLIYWPWWLYALAALMFAALAVSSYRKWRQQ